MIKRAWYMIHTWFWQVIWIGILISFLLLLFNIILSLSIGANIFSKELKERLGVFIYIESNTIEWSTPSDVVNFTKELQEQWLFYKFIDKEEWLTSMQSKFPEIVDWIRELDIQNPLPDTIYVWFDSQDDFRKLQWLTDTYKWIIRNYNIDSGQGDGEKNDATSLSSLQYHDLKSQDNRIENAIVISNVVRYISVALGWMLIAIIVTFLATIIQLTFYRFKQQIDVEKLVWASYLQIKSPFFMKVVFIILIWMVLCVAYICAMVWGLSDYIYSLFSIDVRSFFLDNMSESMIWLSVELIIVSLFSLIVADASLTKMLRSS